MDWQPIETETAPKTGVKVLVAYPIIGGWGNAICHWEPTDYDEQAGTGRGWFDGYHHYSPLWWLPLDRLPPPH